MDNLPYRSHTYLLSLWVDRDHHQRLVWHGDIVTGANQRLHFSTLAELNRWLGELAGWQDPPSRAAATEGENH